MKIRSREQREIEKFTKPLLSGHVRLTRDCHPKVCSTKTCYFIDWSVSCQSENFVDVQVNSVKFDVVSDVS